MTKETKIRITKTPEKIFEEVHKSVEIEINRVPYRFRRVETRLNNPNYGLVTYYVEKEEVWEPIDEVFEGRESFRITEILDSINWNRE